MELYGKIAIKKLRINGEIRRDNLSHSLPSYFTSSIYDKQLSNAKCEMSLNTLFQDSINRALQLRITNQYCPNVTISLNKSTVNLDVIDTQGLESIFKQLPLIVRNTLSPDIYYTDIIIKYNQTEFKLSTRDTMLDIAKYIELLDYVMNSGEVCSISTYSGYSIIASPKMLNDKDGLIQLPRIFNVSRLHDQNFYAGVSLERRNHFLDIDGYIDNFEYMAYLSKDVLDPEKGLLSNKTNIYTHEMYSISQDCKIVTFCGEKAVLSTFKFS